MPDRQLLEVQRLGRFLVLRAIALVVLAAVVVWMGARVARLELEVDALRACACRGLAYACGTAEPADSKPEASE